MNAPSDRPAQRRDRLVARAAAQRAALGQAVEPWRQPLAHLDQGLAALRYIRRHPALIVAGVALFAVFRSARIVTGLRRAWVAWRILHGLRGRP
ncbi:MAG: hypothetical protein HGA75_18575 [Thiobacillus sp.]|nr:hypothetical protein [Thiobacillus sp.]